MIEMDTNPPCKHYNSADVIKDGSVRRINWDNQS